MVGGDGGIKLPGLRLPGAVLLSSLPPVCSLSLDVTFKELELVIGRGGLPERSLLTESCWNERVNVFFGVVGGAGVMLDSLPLNEEATLLVLLAPPMRFLRS